VVTRFNLVIWLPDARGTKVVARRLLFGGAPDGHGDSDVEVPFDTVGHVTLPMTLGHSDTPKASCLTYADAPAFGDCKGPGKVSIPQEKK
jgi:hypothetical protein